MIKLLEILSSYRKLKKYHQLRNGDYLSLADEILSGEHGGLAQLSKEELLELL